MKHLDRALLALGILGLAFCLCVAFANPGVPAVQMQALSTASAALALAGYFGWRTGRNR